MRNQNRNLHHGNKKGFWPNPIFCVYLKWFPACGPPPAAHTLAHHTTQPFQETPAPLCWWSVRFSRGKHCPACSVPPFIPKQPRSHLLLQQQGLLGAAPPLAWVTKGDANDFVLVITAYQVLGIGKITPKPGLKPGISLPYLRDCNTNKIRPCSRSPCSGGSRATCMGWQQLTQPELQDWALNCLKIHYPPMVA